jgi:lysozyme
LTVAASLPHLRDVSNNNGPVDWKLERREGTRFVYCKVSQGLTFTDRTAARRIRNAKWAGIHAGGYHFATPGVGRPEQQADRLLKLAPLAPGSLRPCLDAEWNDLHLNEGQLAAWYLGFVLRVRLRLGYYPTVYASSGNLRWALYHPDVFGRCPLWVASYGVARPTVPAPWTHWSAWQYTDRFRDPAVGRVDDSFAADTSALLVPVRAVLRAAGGGIARLA